VRKGGVGFLDYDDSSVFGRFSVRRGWLHGGGVRGADPPVLRIVDGCCIRISLGRVSSSGVASSFSGEGRRCNRSSLTTFGLFLSFCWGGGERFRGCRYLGTIGGCGRVCFRRGPRV